MELSEKIQKAKDLITQRESIDTELSALFGITAVEMVIEKPKINKINTAEGFVEYKPIAKGTPKP